MKTLALLISTVVLGLSTYGQSAAANGSIVGAVKDSTGASAANAIVVAHNVDTGFERTVQTNESGNFEVLLLPLGTYDVTVNLTGFDTYRRNGVTVEVGRASLLDVQLQVASSQQTVTVEADASMLRLEPAVIGGMNRTSLENMPITSRNVQDLALFAPGLTGRRDDEFGTTQFAFGGMNRRAGTAAWTTRSTSGTRASFATRSSTLLRSSTPQVECLCAAPAITSTIDKARAWRR